MHVPAKVMPPQGKAPRPARMRGWACAKTTSANAPKAKRKAPTTKGSRVGGSRAAVVPVVPQSMAAKITAATPNACFCATANPSFCPNHRQAPAIHSPFRQKLARFKPLSHTNFDIAALWCFHVPGETIR
jgi:hypothetical protein